MKKILEVLFIVLLLSGCGNTGSNGDETPGNPTGTSTFGPADTTAPDNPVKVVFIHHSVGSNLLADTGPNSNGGGLGLLLGQNNYYVRETDYDWDAQDNPGIGSRTDIGLFSYWFSDTRDSGGNGIPDRDDIMFSVYNNTHKEAYPGYTDVLTDPGGENEIVIFKSCYYNSVVRDDNSYGVDSIRRRSSYSTGHTLGNLKILYNEYLEYFKANPDKMFVLIVAPPMMEESREFTLLDGDRGSYIWPTVTEAANGRALANWLVGKDQGGWLAENDWVNKNVYVFDLFNVLSDFDNHHRVEDSEIIHSISSRSDDFLSYPTLYDASDISNNDNHPNTAGNIKAAGEFAPLLNAFYNRWQTWLQN